MKQDGNILADMVAGALAGALATWVMGQVTSFMWKHENPEAKERYQQVTGGRYVPDRSAEKVEQMFGLELTEARHTKLAQSLHWSTGIGAGVAYALLRRRFDRADRGQGLLFGLAFATLFDELMTPLVGLAEPPQRYPWQAHARGLVGHLAFGVAADTMLDLMGQAKAA